MDVKVRQQREKVEQLVKDGEALILGETLGVNIIIIVIIIIIIPAKEMRKLMSGSKWKEQGNSWQRFRFIFISIWRWRGMWVRMNGTTCCFYLIIFREHCKG